MSAALEALAVAEGLPIAAGLVLAGVACILAALALVASGKSDS